MKYQFDVLLMMMIFVFILLSLKREFPYSLL